MEPLKPETKEEILKRNPQAAPADVEADIEEYERLLAEQFTVDPSLPRSPIEANTEIAKKKRLEELHRKLFQP